jgi:hypothetical protein
MHLGIVGAEDEVDPLFREATNRVAIQRRH